MMHGTLVSTVAPTDFWSGVGPFSWVFDPRVAYDPNDGRWIVTELGFDARSPLPPLRAMGARTTLR